MAGQGAGYFSQRGLASSAEDTFPAGLLSVCLLPERLGVVAMSDPQGWSAPGGWGRVVLGAPPSMYPASDPQGAYSLHEWVAGHASRRVLTTVACFVGRLGDWHPAMACFSLFRGTWKGVFPHPGFYNFLENSTFFGRQCLRTKGPGSKISVASAAWVLPL